MMVTLQSLLLPVLLAAVAIFVVSSVIHMATPWHKGDLAPLPDEEGVRRALAPFAIAPGEYGMPRPSSVEDMKSPEFQRKRNEGPVMFLTVLAPGPVSMSRALGAWFVYCCAMGLGAALICAMALPAGADSGLAGRVAGGVAFLGYAGALWQGVVWSGRSPATALRSTIDAVLYGAITGALIAAFWPAA